MSRSGWQPIETAPKDGTTVLISDGEKVWAAEWLDFGEGAAGFSECGTDAPMLSMDQLDECTHWMPLPAPPEGRAHG